MTGESLDPLSVEFAMTAGGVLSLRIGERYYPRVHLYRSFPISAEELWISVRDAEEKEIGMIRSIEELSAGNRRFVIEELDRRYFSPVIETIHSLTEEFGYTYWEVSTSAGRRRFTVQVEQNGVVQLGDGRVLINDVEGNRFEIRDARTVEPKRWRIIELLM